MAGRVFFFTGLSGAGKTTLGTIFHSRLKKQEDNLIFIDGDISRQVYLEDIGYTNEERIRGAKRTFRLVKMLSDQGVDVVVCSMCMYEEIRAWNRENIANYNEIYVRVTKDTLIKRNKKKLYTDGKNVVGVDLPFDEPHHSKLVVDNNGDKTPEEMVDEIWEKLGM